MSSSESVLGRFVKRVGSQYPLPEFSCRAWAALLGPGGSVLANPFDCAGLAVAFASSKVWTNSFLRAIEHPRLGAVEMADLSAKSLSRIDRQLVSGLVYGFGLPELLFADISAEASQLYWRRTLTRAVAVRLAAVRLNRSDIEGLFAAAMVADIGSLVLLRELRQTYVQFVEDAVTQGLDLYRMELESLGFDQRILAARLLSNWTVPPSVAWTVGRATGNDADGNRSDGPPSDDTEVWRQNLFRAGDLLSQLFASEPSDKQARDRIGQLIHLTRTTFGWELADLQRWTNDVMEPAEYLASCFAVDMGETRNPAEVFGEIWNSEVGRQAALETLPETTSSNMGGEFATSPLGPTTETNAQPIPGVSFATLNKGIGRPGPSTDFVPRNRSTATVDRSFADRSTFEEFGRERSSVSTLAVSAESNRSWLSDHLLNGQVQNAIEICRSRRESLSLKLAQIDQFESLLFGGSVDEVYGIQQSLLTGFEQLLQTRGGNVVELGDDRFGFLLPGFDRTAANRIGQEILAAVRQWSLRRQKTGKIGLTLSLGCASTDIPARSLRAAALIEAAARCLENVQRSAGNGLKSIDIYY